ncbi:MAG: EpsI family protein [Burkholderiales bacterium]|jgi:EpsI family protein|nr:EpsI family protein [Burkholderiales bacterium]
MTAPAASTPAVVTAPPLRPFLIATVAMVVAVVLSIAMTPRTHEVATDAVQLDRMVPSEFGRWKELKTAAIQMDLAPRDGEEKSMDQPYDQTVMRTYQRDDGAVVMLALAYGRTQKQEVKIHRPELCYVAQGFEVLRSQRTTLDLGASHPQVPVYRLTTRNKGRQEPVTYWIRIGDQITANALESRMKILRAGLFDGEVPDGLLVRTSSAVPLNAPVDDEYQQQADFLRDLFAAIPPATRTALVGR